MILDVIVDRLRTFAYSRESNIYIFLNNIPGSANFCTVKFPINA